MNEGNKFRFDLWLYNEMKKRGWDAIDLAIESGISEKTIYHLYKSRAILCIEVQNLLKHLM